MLYTATNSAGRCLLSWMACFLDTLQRSRILIGRSLLLLVLTHLGLLQARAQRGEPRKLTMASGPSSPAEQLIFIEANQDRAAHGIAPLSWDFALAAAARRHASVMARANAISHQFAGEVDLQTRTMEAGAHFSVVAENVAEDPEVAAINDAWMHSAGHRANLLDPRLNAIGVGLAQRGGEWFAVEDFSRRVEAVSLAGQEQQVGALVAQYGVALLPARQARDTCKTDAGYAGAREPMFTMRYTATSLGRLPDVLTARLRSGKYHVAAVGACDPGPEDGFTTYRLAVLLF